MQVLRPFQLLVVVLAVAEAARGGSLKVARTQSPPVLLSAKRSLPEPYGHTAQVSPHLPNSDREWYTEYRWGKGKEYKPQDGVITTKPKHAPVPKRVEEKKSTTFGEPLNQKPEQTAASDESKGHEGEKTKAEHASASSTGDWSPAAGANAADAKEVSWKPSSSTSTKPTKEEEVDLDSKKAVRPPGVGTGTTLKTEPTYAVPKPCGHTSQVHPFNGNSDREWYTEYRWKPGTEYKPQDGPITEKPKASKSIFAKPTYNDPCV